MPLTKFTRNTDGTYGPTKKRQDYYISKPDHRRTAKFKKGKTRWAIEEGQEFAVFKPSNEDYEIWFCKQNNCIFALVDGGNVILGKNGERIAKFPNDRSENEPWHGYPVFCDASQNRPSSELLDAARKHLPLHVIVKIEKGLL